MKKILSVILFLLWMPVAWAESFVVNNIQVEGTERISTATVESYLPIKRGQTLTSEKTASVVRALYQTGFFDSVTLGREGNTLVVHVVERPIIGQLKISGNSAIPKDRLDTVLKSLDVVEGRVYNAAVLERIKEGLLNQYYSLGRYNARVDINTTPMPRNRVMVKITISEGLVAKIKGISIIGNHVFDEDTLVKQLDISTSGIFTVFTQSDRYSEEKLNQSLDKLRGYYMDRGYIRFDIKSSQAAIAPDRKSVYVTVVVEEGSQYTLKDYQLSGNLILPRDVIEKNILIKRGDIFSRQKVMDSEKAINKLLGDKGYMYAVISLRPNINDKDKTVSLTFDFKPGKRIYVRHVTFSDNTRTNDEVLRREVQQLEAAPASTSKIEETKRRLNLLPFIRDNEMSVKPVPNKDDQVDVNYKVKENSSAQLSFKVGYSQLYGVMLGAGMDQKNFLGTGNTLGINFQRSRYQQYYTVDYTNPYYTEDGVSRTFNFSVSRTDPRGANLNDGYTANEYNLGVMYGIPLSDADGVISRLQAGFSYQNTLINLVSNQQYVSTQISTYLNDHTRRFREGDFKLGYSRNSLDKAVFPTSGVFQAMFLDAYAPLAHGSVSFYTLNYSGKWYQPLSSDDQFIAVTRGDVGYGTGLHGSQDFPFFRNFYAGGMGSVRGYTGNTLGPLDSRGKPYGGNMLADASLALIFPNYLNDNLRTSVFVDAGNVYSSFSNNQFGGSSANAGPIRYSTGVQAEILTPLGLIDLSLSKRILARPHDQVEAFQFSLGANF
jgi:outer membrane protein insertion porin family